MKFKDFIRPTTQKITLFLLLIIFFSLLGTGFIKNPAESLKVFPEINTLGFPLNFYHLECIGLEMYPPQTRCASVLTPLYLFLDLIFWYLLSCLIFYAYPGKKRRK